MGWGPWLPSTASLVPPPVLPGMGGGGMGSPIHQPVGVPDDEELADVMHRNQQVSTTAIQRAQESAAQGDVDSAADTLKMAINIIKQSSVARMDSTQVGGARGSSCPFICVLSIKLYCVLRPSACYFSCVCVCVCVFAGADQIAPGLHGLN